MQNLKSIFYTVTKSAITFVKEGMAPVMVSIKNRPLYIALSNILNETGKLETLFESDVVPKNVVEVLGLNYLTVEKRVKDFESSGFPISPFIKFLERIDPVFLKNNLSLIDKVGSSDVPLTMDGTLVMYQRSSWLPYDKEKPLEWVGEFTPFRTVNGVSKLGTFTWTVDKCPDTGLMYEVLVAPENIKVWGELTEAEDVIQLSCLGQYITKDKMSESGLVEFTTNCSKAGVIVVRNPYNVETATFMLSSLANGVQTEEHTV